MEDDKRQDFAALVTGAERLARPWRYMAVFSLLSGAVLSFVFLRQRKTKTDRRL
jgi:hypothetical protein